MRGNGIFLYLGTSGTAELQALIINCKKPRKQVWRAGIVLATAEGHSNCEITRGTGRWKPRVWCLQRRYLDEDVAGLKRDTTWPSQVPPLPPETELKVIAKTVQEAPPNATPWSSTLIAAAMGISPSSMGLYPDLPDRAVVLGGDENPRSERLTAPKD